MPGDKGKTEEDIASETMAVRGSKLKNYHQSLPRPGRGYRTKHTRAN